MDRAAGQQLAPEVARDHLLERTAVLRDAPWPAGTGDHGGHGGVRECELQPGAFMLTPCRSAMALMAETFWTIAGVAGAYSKFGPPTSAPEL